MYSPSLQYDITRIVRESGSLYSGNSSITPGCYFRVFFCGVSNSSSLLAIVKRGFVFPHSWRSLHTGWLCS